MISFSNTKEVAEEILRPVRPIIIDDEIYKKYLEAVESVLYTFKHSVIANYELGKLEIRGKTQ